MSWDPAGGNLIVVHGDDQNTAAVYGAHGEIIWKTNIDGQAAVLFASYGSYGFENILSTSSLSPLCLAEQYLESLSFVDGYFSGGDTDNSPIPTGSGPFLTINANYNNILDNQHLTITEVSPGFNKAK